MVMAIIITSFHAALTNNVVSEEACETRFIVVSPEDSCANVPSPIDKFSWDTKNKIWCHPENKRHPKSCQSGLQPHSNPSQNSREGHDLNKPIPGIDVNIFDNSLGNFTSTMEIDVSKDIVVAFGIPIDAPAVNTTPCQKQKLPNLRRSPP